MAELKAHAAPDETALEHGASPRRARDRDRHRLRAVLRVAGDKRGAFAQDHDGVAVVLGPDFEDGRLGQVTQEDAALDLRLHDLMVHLIAEVGMTDEGTCFQVQKMTALSRQYSALSEERKHRSEEAKDAPCMLLDS